MADLNTGYGKMKSIYRMSDPQPDWEQVDPSQPDYIKNKEGAQEVRAIYINGVEILSNSSINIPLNLIAGENIELITNENNVIINAKGSGGSCDCPTFEQGDGILVTEISIGKKEISLDKEFIEDEIVQKIAQEQISNWVLQDEQLAPIFNRLASITKIVDIDEPISEYVEQTISEYIVENVLPPASSSQLGGVKFDDETIKMNENQQIYVSKMSTDGLENGEKTLILNGGNDL